MEINPINHKYLHFGPVLCETKTDLNLCKELLERGEKIRGVRKPGPKTPLSTKVQIQSNYSHKTNAWFVENFKPYFIPYFKKLQDKNYYGMRQFNRVSLNAMWINYMQKNEYNRPHTHGGSFSFCLYLQVPEAIYTASGQYPKIGVDGKPIGIGGISSIEPGSVIFWYGEDQTGIVTAHGIKPTAGDLWLFPAPLRHMVPPFRINGTRISVSGHLTISDELNKGQPIQPNEFILNN